MEETQENLNTTEKIIADLKVYFDVKKNTELARHLEVPVNSLSNWKKKDLLKKILQRIKELEINIDISPYCSDLEVEYYTPNKKVVVKEENHKEVLCSILLIKKIKDYYNTPLDIELERLMQLPKGTVSEWRKANHVRPIAKKVQEHNLPIDLSPYFGITVEALIIQAKDHFGISSDGQLAEKLNISQSQVSAWRKENSMSLMVKKLREIDAPRELLMYASELMRHKKERRRSDRKRRNEAERIISALKKHFKIKTNFKLAEKLNISPSSVSLWKRENNPVRLLEIAKELDLPIEVLVKEDRRQNNKEGNFNNDHQKVNGVLSSKEVGDFFGKMLLLAEGTDNLDVLLDYLKGCKKLILAKSIKEANNGKTHTKDEKGAK